MRYATLFAVVVSAYVNLEANPRIAAAVYKYNAAKPEDQASALDKLTAAVDDVSPGQANIVAAAAPGAAMKQIDNTPGNPQIDPLSNVNGTKADNSTAVVSDDGSAISTQVNGTAPGVRTAILTGAANKTSAGPAIPTGGAVRSGTRVSSSASRRTSSASSSASSGVAAPVAAFPLGSLAIAAIPLLL